MASEPRTGPYSEKAPRFPGSGTQHDPYLVDWYDSDPENPLSWSNRQKWLITLQLGLCSWTASFGSSSYSAGIPYTMRDLHISEVVAVLGISVYVLGFALGPLMFAPMSELFGRRIIFLCSLGAYIPLQLGGSLGRNLPTLLACRLLAGICGSSPLTNAGGVVSDIWAARERGLAAAVYGVVPFLGPIFGPIVGGVVADNPKLGWHFNFWLMFIFASISFVTNYLFCPETYAPVLLERRAEQLTRESGGKIIYVSNRRRSNSSSLLGIVLHNLRRPVYLFCTEPIVFLLAVYNSIVYGTLYALFAAYPIVFQQHRGWTPTQGGLAFLGVGAGVLVGVSSAMLQNRIYWDIMDASPTGIAPPEARLHMAMIGAVLCPIGLLWFAWPVLPPCQMLLLTNVRTTPPSIHWAVPVIAAFPFGAGTAMIMLGASTYMMDTYGIHFASAMASAVVLRSICGAAFPLIAPNMFGRLGDSWAMSVFGFLSLVCTPIPYLFWYYGPWIRSKSRHGAQLLDQPSNESVLAPRRGIEAGAHQSDRATTS